VATTKKRKAKAATTKPLPNSEISTVTTTPLPVPIPVTNVTGGATSGQSQSEGVVSPVNIDSTVHNKCVPKKSRCNKAADAIGTDGISFLTGKENSHLDAEAAFLLK
jgi:hypothetical protein